MRGKDASSPGNILSPPKPNARGVPTTFQHNILTLGTFNAAAGDFVETDAGGLTRTVPSDLCDSAPTWTIFGRKVAPASSRDILTLGAPNAAAGGFVKTAMGGVQGTVATDPRYFPPSPAKVPSIEARGTVAYYVRDGTEEDVLRDDEGFIVSRPWTGAVYSASCSSSPGGEGQTGWWPWTGTV